MKGEVEGVECPAPQASLYQRFPVLLNRCYLAHVVAGLVPAT